MSYLVQIMGYTYIIAGVDEKISFKNKPFLSPFPHVSPIFCDIFLSSDTIRKVENPVIVKNINGPGNKIIVTENKLLETSITHNYLNMEEGVNPFRDIIRAIAENAGFVASGNENFITLKRGKQQYCY